MFEYTIIEEGPIRCMVAKGRIDSLSSPDIQKIFDELILSGHRTLLVDMTSVHYVSSAGIRVFISTQKSLQKAGGEILLSGITGSVYEIFKMSGLLALFRIATNRNEVSKLLQKDTAGINIVKHRTGGILIEYTEWKENKGTPLFVVAKQDKTADSLFTETDVVPVKPGNMQFGCGLATLGDTYDEYKLFFGESMVVNNSFFFYPAVRHPSVDFLINAHKNPDITYKFLHGFGFSGDYRYVLSFEGEDSPVELSSLVRSFFTISQARMLGICILAESKGLWGMHIKQVPVTDQKPVNGKSIFDSNNFSDWIYYPVDPSYTNNIIIAVGIAVRERGCLDPERSFLIPEGSSFHIHGGIFDKCPIGNSIAGFDKELSRIWNECEVHKVQHLLGLSRFSGGMAALIELEA